MLGSKKFLQVGLCGPVQTTLVLCVFVVVIVVVILGLVIFQVGIGIPLDPRMNSRELIKQWKVLGLDTPLCM